jgi:hypothetical protein
VAVSSKAILDLSDDALKTIIRANAPVTAISKNDMLSELERRATRRQTLAALAISTISVVIATAALVVTALRA